MPPTFGIAAEIFICLESSTALGKCGIDNKLNFYIFNKSNKVHNNQRSTYIRTIQNEPIQHVPSE